MDFKSQIRDSSLEHGRRCGEHLIDYFVFPKGLYDHVPPFAIGRPCYDSWLIYKPISRRYSVVDATNEVMVTHQNHTHAHLGINKEGYTLKEAFELDKCKRNYDLLGGDSYRFGTNDASHVLTEAGECKPKLSSGDSKLSKGNSCMKHWSARERCGIAWDCTN